MAEQTQAELGVIVSRHLVDNRPRRVLAGWGLVLGTLAGIAGIAAVTADHDGPYNPWTGYFQGTLIGLAVAGLGIGILSTGQAIRGGRKEYVELHEGGLVYVNAFRTQVWPWARVAELRTKEYDNNVQAIARYGGWHRRCVINFAGGGVFRFNALTDRYTKLVGAIEEKVPASAKDPALHRKRLYFWLWPALASALVFVALIVYIQLNPDTEADVQHTGYTLRETVDGISEDGWAFVGIGLGVSAVVAVACLIQFAVTFAKRPR